MTYVRNAEHNTLLAETLNLVAVVGLWLVVCSISRLPGYRRALDMI